MGYSRKSVNHAGALILLAVAALSDCSGSASQMQVTSSGVDLLSWPSM